MTDTELLNLLDTLQTRSDVSLWRVHGLTNIAFRGVDKQVRYLRAESLRELLTFIKDYVEE